MFICDFTAQVTFDGDVGVDIFADRQDFGVGQIVDATGDVDADGFADVLGHRAGQCREYR